MPCIGRHCLSDQTFVSHNVLETSLLSAQSGQLEVGVFLNMLMDSQVFILLDKEVVGTTWDNSVTPLILTNKAGTAVMAMFSAPERSTPWSSRNPTYGYGLLVAFEWIIKGLGSGMGVVLNPGHPVGLEITPDEIDRLRGRR